MAKDWNRYKNEIKTLYLTNGRSLNDVRRILKGRYNFDASVRAYRMKLESWSIKKNKVPAGVGRNTHPRRKTKTINIARSSSGAQASDDVGDPLENTNFPSLSHPDDNATWVQGIDNSTLDRTSQTVPPYHDNLYRPYIQPSNNVDLPTSQDLFRVIYESTEQELLEHLSFGASVEVRDNFNNSPLHAAVVKPNIAMAQALLKYGADVDAIGFKGKTPLHLSVVSKTMVQLLLKHQPNLSLQDEEGNSVLHYLLRLPNWWADLDIRMAIKSVLFAGANVNIQNKAGESPLRRIIAETLPASLGYMEIILEFLKCKPDVTTPMRHDQDLIRVFLENTSILQEDTKRYRAPEWVEMGFRCLKQFLVEGANPNFVFHSQPLLHYCLESGKFREGRLSGSFLTHLLEEADLDVPASNGNSPLHVALMRRTNRWYNEPTLPFYEITSTLIARQVDVSKPNRAGASPLELWLAGYRQQPALAKVTKLLLEAGASSMIKTTSGKSLFDLITYQTREHRTSLTRILLEADIDTQQHEDDTATASEWVACWRSAWKSSLWSIARIGLTKLEFLETRPKSKNFMEVAFLVIAERLLEIHRSRLIMVLEGKSEKEGAREDYEEYCAILKNCRERKADIDDSFYHFLLDIMGF